MDFFRGRHSWRKFRTLLDGLPSTSHYITALLDDPEYAEWAASQPEAPATPPSLTDWSPEVARLSDIYDRLGEVVNAIIASANGKPLRLQPAPRPVTGVHRAREDRARQRHAALVSEVKAAQERWKASSGSRPAPQ